MIFFKPNKPEKDPKEENLKINVDLWEKYKKDK